MYIQDVLESLRGHHLETVRRVNELKLLCALLDSAVNRMEVRLSTIEKILMVSRETEAHGDGVQQAALFDPTQDQA